MKQFKIFEHPAGKFQAVKLGWCWPAFFFPIIWALLARMWGLSGIVLGIAFFVSFVITEGTSGVSETEAFFNLVLSITFGIKGNEWREQNLRCRGFEAKGTILAANKEGAIALFIQNASAGSA